MLKEMGADGEIPMDGPLIPYSPSQLKNSGSQPGHKKHPGILGSRRP